MNTNAINILIATSLLLHLTTYCINAQSTEDMQIMYYNVLNFPNPTNTNPFGNDAARHIYFREIIETEDVDIVVLQECKALFGVQDLVAELNTNGTLGKTYAYSSNLYTYSGLGNMIIYNDDKMDLLDHIELPRTNFQMSANGTSHIAPRANSRFILQLTSSQCPSENIRLEVYAGHFKGSNGNETSTKIADRDRRQLSALDFMDYIDTIPITRNIIMGGDFNLYADNDNGGSNSEPAFVTLTNSTFQHQFVDVIGGWIRNTATEAYKYTQSTRTSQSEFGNGGSSGGLDDRFDMILFNQAIDQGSNQLVYIQDSYATVGRPDSLNSNATVSTSIIKDQLYKMSDHYPVKLGIRLNFPNCNTTCEGIVINELHYDNINIDTNEFIEVSVPSAASLNLAEYTVTLYNGGNGMAYASQSLDQFVLGTSNSVASYYTWNPNSIQNGSPDGLGLSRNGEHCELLSYEGSFVAMDGPAVSMAAVDIDVMETPNTPVHESLQLINGEWFGPIAQTFGDLNSSGDPCQITNASITNAQCTGTDFVFDVNFTIENGSNLFEVIDITNGNVAVGSGTASPIPISLSNNTSTSAIDIVVRNVLSPSCTSDTIQIALLDCTPTCGDIFINEIAYDNTGADVNEFIEIAVSNTLATTLSNYTISLYNGNSGTVYQAKTLNNFVLGQSDANYSYYTWHPSSIQNGDPDGVALSTSLLLCEFISYEGAMTATSGPAKGMTSMDIGVSESSTEPIGHSLQLVNGIWLGQIEETVGLPNLDPNCATQHSLTGSEIGVADYETSGKISSTQLIGSAALVDYDAAAEITLDFPFEVMLGGVLEAFIDGCNQGSGGVN